MEESKKDQINEEPVEDTQAKDSKEEQPEPAAEKDSKKEEKKAKRKKKDTDKEKVEELGEKLAEINDKYLRLYSEFDNYRKRTIKEKADLLKSASSEVIVSMLPVMDDFERALKAFDEAEDFKALKEGVDLIFNKFKKTLENKGVKEIECQGKEFDTDYHEAITQIPAPSEEMKGKIVDVVEKGYILNEKVIRFPKVVVGQ